MSVDLIFRPPGIEVTPELLDRAERMEVEAVTMPVLALDDLFVTQLLSLSERHLAYAGLIESARAVREQVDWDAVRARTESATFARAFFTMVEGLGVIEPAPSAGEGGR